MSKDEKRVALTLTREMYEQVQALSQESCRTVPKYILQLVKRHLSECRGTAMQE